MGRCKSTPADKWNRQVVDVVWKETGTLRLQFLLDVNFLKWQASGEREWGARVGLLSLDESECRPIREELVYDFVEGYDRTSTQAKFVSILRGESIAVTRGIVHEALDLVEEVDKIPKENATGLLAIVGNAAKGHEGYLVKQCMVA